MCRLFDIQLPPNLPVLKKQFLEATGRLISKKNPGDFNQAIMEMGQTVCTLADPSCDDCPLSEYCLSKERGTQALAPAAKKKAEKIAVKMRLHVLEKNGKIGLVTRPNTAKFLKESKGFCTEFSFKDSTLGGDGIHLKYDGRRLKKVGSFTHSITKHAISVEVVLVNEIDCSQKISWFSRAKVSEQLVSSLDMKALKIYLKSL
jgi:A/G-specific adenine glycosylase